MATKKAGGSTKNGRDSNPKYLGIKVNSGERATAGAVIVRQRGTKIEAGKNTRLGKDHTVFSMATGKVVFSEKRKTNYDGQVKRKKVVSVVAA